MAPTEKFASMQSNANRSPSVSIVIPCRNEIDHIASCLSSIFDQCEVPGGFEVIVADGMSDDGTREILKRLSEEDSRLTVVDNPGGIVSSGLNAALRDAQRIDHHPYGRTHQLRSGLYSTMRWRASGNRSRQRRRPVGRAW